MLTGSARRFKESLFVLLVAVVATVIMTFPLAPKIGHVGRVNTSDGQFSIWNVAWVARALLTDPVHVYDANIFWPSRGTLAWSEANLGAGFLAIPGWWASKNPFLAHNSVVLFAFVLSATGAYTLARYLTGNRGAAAFAGIAFAFCPFIYARTAHVQLLMTAGLPWSLWACHHVIDAPRLRREIALGVILTAQALSCAYYGIFAGLSVALAVVFYGLTRALWRSVTYWIRVAVAGATSVVLVLPFFLPYLRVQEAGFSRSLEEATEYSADWRAYLASNTLAHRWMHDLLGSWKEVLFPGFLTTLLAVAACWWALRGQLRGTDHSPARSSEAGDRRSVRLPANLSQQRPAEAVTFYLLLTLLAAWTSFGPGGGLYTAMFTLIPVFSFLRAPARFGIVVTLGLVLCAAIAVAHLSRLRPEWRRALPLALTMLVGAELLAIPLPLPEVNPTPRPVYRTLASLPAGPVCEFPFFFLRSDFPRHASYMLDSTAHWHPLINGYSDHIPSDFSRIVMPLSSFPTKESFDILRARRARYVTFHLNWYDTRSRAKLLERLDHYAAFLKEIVKDDDVWLYEIVAWPE